MTGEQKSGKWPWVLLVVGLSQMIGDLIGVAPLKAVAAATMVAPAPKVFCAVKGLETYSTRFFIEWTDRDGAHQSLELTAEICQGLRGPYNRRNVYGAALSYGPVLATDRRARPMLAAVLEFGLCGERPLMRELGVDPATVAGSVRLRFEPLPGSDLGDLPRELEVPLR